MKVYEREVDGSQHFYLSESRFFRSLVELISCYEHTSLGENFIGYVQHESFIQRNIDEICLKPVCVIDLLPPLLLLVEEKIPMLTDDTNGGFFVFMWFIVLKVVSFLLSHLYVLSLQVEAGQRLKERCVEPNFLTLPSLTRLTNFKELGIKRYY